jgi:hypothetical protein
MPWGFGKKTVPLADSLSASMASSAPAGSTRASLPHGPTAITPVALGRFRIDEFMAPRIMSALPVGEKVNGVLIPPTSRRRGSPTSEPNAPATIPIGDAFVNRDAVKEVVPGKVARLTVTGINGAHTYSKVVRASVKEGDRLVSP